MKECPKCKGTHPDELVVCPECRRLLHEPGVELRPDTDEESYNKATTRVRSFDGAGKGEPGEERQPLEPGTVIGSYEVERLVGQGGMGEVYSATHITLGRRFALKLLRSKFGWRKELIRRFYLEARAASQVEHPNIVSITDFIESEDGEFCYAMEYLDGQPLEELLEEGTPTLEEALTISVQIADGLDALHEAGVIHRDLKPGNVFLVRREGKPVQVKLLDFGIIKLSQDSELVDELAKATAKRRVLGTPYYMSPEQVMALKTLDHRTDIYSLGVIMYEMISGQRPIESKSTAEMFKDVVTRAPISPENLTETALPPQLVQLIMCCLEKSADNRPQRSDEVVAALKEVEQAMVEASAAPRRRALLILAAVLLLTGGVSLAALLWPVPPPPAPAVAPRIAVKERPIATLASLWEKVDRRARESVSWEPAQLKMDLFRLDAVRTGPGSGAEVRFKRGSGLEVGEESVVLIEELAPADGGAQGPAIRLRKGAMRGELLSGNALRLFTPKGKLVQLEPEGSDKVTYRVVTRADGTVEVALLTGSARLGTGKGAVKLRKGQAVDVGGARVTPPALLPQYPELLMPEVDQELSGQVTFGWSTVERAASYRLQVAESTNFRGLLVNRVLESNREVIKDLDPGKYVWRVSTIDRQGREGEYGFARRFQLMVPAAEENEPGMPLVVRASPRDGREVATAKTAKVSFQWQGGAPPFRLVLAKNRALARPVVTLKKLPGPSVVVKGLLPGKYFWALYSEAAKGKPRRLFKRSRMLQITRIKPPRLDLPEIKWERKK